MVSFPSKDDPDFVRWVEAMPNQRNELMEQKDIWICGSHFDCEYKTIRGGKRPLDPPSVFPHIPKSHFKQVVPKRRSTELATAQQRQQRVSDEKEQNDKIVNFENFVKSVAKHVDKKFIFNRSGDNFTMFMTDDLGRRVVKFLHFREEISPFGFLRIMGAEKNGFDVPKVLLDLQKNHFIHRWSQLKFILSAIDQYEPSSEVRINTVLADLENVEEWHDDPTFQFITDQLHLMMKPPNRRRYATHTLVFAVELFGVSPAAYRMLRRSKSIVLPREKRVREVLGKTESEENLSNLFKSLDPEQRLVNILFDEVKLISTIRLTAGHVIGMAENNSEKVASHALVIELVCHHGGPSWVMRVIPVACMKALELKKVLMETITSVRKSGGLPLALIGDNASTNQSAYRLMGGPGIIYLEGIPLFLIYDYIHIFKNIRNNWYTEVTRQLIFTVEGKDHLACWDDIVNLYLEDKKTPLRMTKLTQISVSPKPLQRQSVPLVCNVFNEKTVAAFRAHKEKKTFTFNEGTVLFVELISQWFKMMNVKDTVSCIKLRDDDRKPWSQNCNPFLKLGKICDVISSCRWGGVRGRQQKLTANTADAFVITTRTVVAASKHLLVNHGFQYVLPGKVWSDEILEKFFGKTRQRTAGNFYIDLNDVKASAKVQRAHQLMKRGIFPEGECQSSCPSCTMPLDEKDIDLLSESTIQQTQELLSSDSSLKHKAVYVAGFLAHKHKIQDASESLSSEYLDSLSRGGLTIPTLNTVFFVHSAIKIYEGLPKNKKHCYRYVIKLFTFIDVPFAHDNTVCRTIFNVISKAYVLNESDVEKTVGCLRRQEKLSEKKVKK